MNSFYDFQNAIITTKTDGVVLFCPFSIARNDKIRDAVGVPVRHDGVKIICAKENANDKCEIRGEARHLEIAASGVTVLGLDFVGSKNGAIGVIHGRGTSIIDCNFRE